MHAQTFPRSCLPHSKRYGKKLSDVWRRESSNRYAYVWMAFDMIPILTSPVTVVHDSYLSIQSLPSLTRKASQRTPFSSWICIKSPAQSTPIDWWLLCHSPCVCCMLCCCFTSCRELIIISYCKWVCFSIYCGSTTSNVTNFQQRNWHARTRTQAHNKAQ